MEIITLLAFLYLFVNIFRQKKTKKISIFNQVYIKAIFSEGISDKCLSRDSNAGE